MHTNTLTLRCESDCPLAEHLSDEQLIQDTYLLELFTAAHEGHPSKTVELLARYSLRPQDGETAEQLSTRRSVYAEEFMT